MSSEMVGRVLQRMRELGMNPRSASLAAGLNQTFIRDMVRRPDSSPSIGNMRKLAAALQTTVESLVGAGPSEDGAPRVETREAMVGSGTGLSGNVVLARYGGIVEATAFRPVEDIVDPDRGPEVVPRDSRYPRGAYVVFDVMGDSMDAADPPIPGGSQVIVVEMDNPNRPIVPQTGDIVVIRRTREQGGLIELSVKELELGEAETRYLPRSRNKRHRAIVVPKDFKPDEATVVEVLGLVIGVVAKVRRK